MIRPHIQETIVVEGKYDKIKLDSLLSAHIIVTYGFRIFQNKEALSQMKSAAQKNGIVILTDSDAAGFKIRHYIKQFLPKETLLQAYIPDIYGKEPRKAIPSKEGKLGVEGVDGEVILNALTRAGCHFEGEKNIRPSIAQIQKSDLYTYGLVGHAKSAHRRQLLCNALSLPAQLSSTALLDMLNILFSDVDTFSDFLQNNHLFT